MGSQPKQSLYWDKGLHQLLCDTVQYSFQLKWLMVFLLNHFTSDETCALETKTEEESRHTCIYFIWTLVTVNMCVLSHFIGVWLFATPGTMAHQAPLSMEFSRQEYWSALAFPPPGNLPDPGIEPTSPASPALADRFFTRGDKREFLLCWMGANEFPISH